MATQYEPIVKDSTLNTTEQTPRNLADVLASGLANIANNVKPDGGDISIDVPGMSANNVDDGFSELKQSLDDKLNYDDNRENISLTMLDAYTTTFIKEGFFNTTCPFPNKWGILLSVCGSNTREQVIFTTDGVAIRHWESNTWSAWTIIN